MKIIKQDIEFEEWPKQILEFIYESSSVTPTYIYMQGEDALKELKNS